MQLRDWRLQQGLSQAEAGWRLGGIHQRQISRYETGANMPGRRQMALILAGTNGQVTANDFHEPPVAGAAVQDGAREGGSEGAGGVGAAPAPPAAQLDDAA